MEQCSSEEGMSADRVGGPSPNVAGPGSTHQSVPHPVQEERRKFLPSLMLIKHPCVVRDGSEQRAIAMLGGIDQIEHNFSVGNIRMQLNFRIDGDSCSKGIFGSHRDLLGVWAVVRRYRNVRTGEVVCRSEPVGVVRHVYDFDGMADFQYLPAVFGSGRNPPDRKAEQAEKQSSSSSSTCDKQASQTGTTASADVKTDVNQTDGASPRARDNATSRVTGGEARPTSEPHCSHGSSQQERQENVGYDLRPELIPGDVADIEYDSFMHTTPDQHLFIIPQVFARIDAPFSGIYRHVTDTRLRRRDETGLPILRKQRTNFATIVRLLAPPHGDPVPHQAQPEALEQFMAVDEALRARVTDAFKRRPVWTKSALAYELGIDRGHLKTVIIGLAYCVNQGPFRLCWVRYGFDPRTDRSVKVLQTLDCRVKASASVYGRRAKSTSLAAAGTSASPAAATTTTTTTTTTAAATTTATTATTTTANISSATGSTTSVGGAGSWEAPTVRGGHVAPVQIAPSGYRKKRSWRDESGESRESRERTIRTLRCRYIPGRLPHTRQLLYHLRDIGLDSVQELIHRNDGSEIWSDQDGWCLPGTIGHIRDYLAEDMKKTAERQRGASQVPREEVISISSKAADLSLVRCGQLDESGDLHDEEIHDKFDDENLEEPTV